MKSYNASADWLLLSTERLILQVNSNISVTRGVNELGQKTLVATNIPSSDISGCLFLTNTDFNNNILSLTDMSIYISGNSNPLVIPGFSEIAINLFNQADISAFQTSSKVFYPFIIPPSAQSYLSTANGQILTPPGTPITNFNEFVSYLTWLLPFTPKPNYPSSTYTYQIVLTVT